MPRTPSVWSPYFKNNSFVEAAKGEASTGVLIFRRLKKAHMILTDAISGTDLMSVFEWGFDVNGQIYLHNNRANVGWSDGHVTSCSPNDTRQELRELLDQNGNMKYYTKDYMPLFY